MVIDTILIDEITKFWNANPCNIRHGYSKYNTKEFFSEISARRYHVESHIKKFADFSNWKNKRVLEIGCGIGSDAEEFAKAGAEYVGIDISKISIDISKNRFQLLGLPGTFICRDASDTLSDLGHFDLIYSYGVLHHHPLIDQIIDNIKQVMHVDSQLKFMVYAKHSWKYAMIQNDLDQFESADYCPYARVFCPTDIQLLLKDKLKIQSIEQDHCFMYNVEEYKLGNYKLEPWFEIMSTEVKNVLNTHLGWHLLVNAIHL